MLMYFYLYESIFTYMKAVHILPLSKCVVESFILLFKSQKFPVDYRQIANTFFHLGLQDPKLQYRELITYVITTGRAAPFTSPINGNLVPFNNSFKFGSKKKLDGAKSGGCQAISH